MADRRGMPVYFLAIIATLSICNAVASSSVVHPVSDPHRSAAVELFTPAGRSLSLEETYEALRTFEVLGVGKAKLRSDGCLSVLEVLKSAPSSPKDLYYALKVNGLSKCTSERAVFEIAASRLKAALSDASSLLDYHYTVGGLVLIKDQSPDVDVALSDAKGTFQSIKALSQSDGRWRYGSNNPESSTYAAGVALETLAGIIKLEDSEISPSMISAVGNDIKKLFDSIEKYDDGTFYFDEKVVESLEYRGPLATSSAVVVGLSSFASVASEKIDIPGEVLLGLAKFFLAIGVPGDSKDLFYQINALACLENNRRVSVPLILSLPATVLSLTKKDQLKVRVTTVLGANSPPLKLKLRQVLKSDAADVSVIDSQELTHDSEGGFYYLDVLPDNIDVGKYKFVFQILLEDPEHKKSYATGGRIHVPIYVSGVVNVENAVIAVLDSDLGTVDTQKNLDLVKRNDISLSANHLQKLRLSFQLSTPRGLAYTPHQAFLRLKHETKVEHIFVVGNTGKQFELVLDFLRLVEKFYYLSGRYELEVAVGDSVMENSFLWPIGHIELDIPEAPEKAPRPPPVAADPYSRFEVKAEIQHIFRAPEKRPPKELSLAFLGLSFLPFIGFLGGLLSLGVNLKNFPSAPVPATFALLFQVGIGAVLGLYMLFWLKLDLFTTLKAVGLLGAFLLFVGHRILSHLAATSAKLKSA
ncbi:hypothetical protein MLD38_026456 [Melastoma candidum]|uniref:Uncharacterized protein n=1 Tax=Melastoma candidum TaxID=119954 RepID=A0ACB9NYN3_9MYRT|nr:hypothetical protein MLD38_026456 [Melastoma candidum]